MQPVQDLTVEDRVSRTQFQYTLEDPNADELNALRAAECWRSCKQMPELTRRRQRPADAGHAGASWCIDRDTASRLGITPSMIDQTLYDAYGQREVSTMFTQLNQYHVVLEVKPGFQQDPLDLAQFVHPHGRGQLRRQRGPGCGRDSRPPWASRQGPAATAPRASADVRSLPDRRDLRRPAPCSTAASRHRRRYSPTAGPGSPERLHPHGIDQPFRSPSITRASSRW